jgi:nucleoside-diphosphate-sugar epimerase
MKFLVSGSSGFIGSYTAKELIRLGHDVKFFDITGLMDLSFLPQNTGEFIVGDLRNSEDCLNACKDVDVIIHCAAVASISRTVDYPIEASEINITGMLNLLEASLASGVKRFVFLSSAKIYGDIEKYPSSEEDMPRPLTPYALTKFVGEYHCRYFSEHHGLTTVCLRPFSVYGPRQNIKNGYIGNIIESVCNDKIPEIPGTPEVSRDFTYIDDVVQSCIQAAFVRKIKFGIFNVGSGKAYSLSEVLSIVNKLTGRNIRPHYVPLVPGTAIRTYSDISKAKEILQFEPRIGLEEGLKKMVRWYLSTKGIEEK